MDREKELFEWIRGMYLEMRPEDKKDAERFFPELVESEDEKIIDGFRTLLDGINRKGGLTLNEVPLQKCYAYLEKQKEQKPAEWSLTDATLIEEIDETLFMAETGRNEVVKNQIERERNWLKSLPERFNLQSKQEWSAADEEMLDAMIDIVSNSLYEPLCPREGMLDWLKSLRPHWKPSEEQMDALNSIMLTGSFTYVGQVQDLISLKADLKKLM